MIIENGAFATLRYLTRYLKIDQNVYTPGPRLPSMAFYPEYLGMQMPIMQLPKVQNCNLNAQLLETASQEYFID